MKLLRAGEIRRSDPARGGAFRRVERRGEAEEVQDLYLRHRGEVLAFENEEEIPRVNRVVNDPVQAGRNERIDHLGGHAQGHARREHAVLPDPLRRRLALEVFGYVDQLIVVEAKVEQPRDVRMGDLLRGAGLGAKLFALGGGVRAGWLQFHRDQRPALGILGQERGLLFATAKHDRKSHSIEAHPVATEVGFPVH